MSQVKLIFSQFTLLQVPNDRVAEKELVYLPYQYGKFSYLVVLEMCFMSTVFQVLKDEETKHCCLNVAFYGAEDLKLIQ